MDDSEKCTEKPSRAALFQKLAADYLMTVRSVYYNGCLYTYRGKCYRPEQEPEVMLLRWFQKKQIPLKTSDISNILAHVKAYSLMDANKFPEIPFFIKGRSDHPKNFIPFQNGLLNLAKHCQGITELVPHTPDFVSLYALPFDFDPVAKCPQWLDFLGQVFEGDEDRIRLLQEWFGYCLTPDVSLQKFMVLLGLPRSGKGTTSSILGQLLGPENTTAFDLYRLLDRFSMTALRTKQLAVVGEVELSGAKEKARILEKLKTITGNDIQVVERKGVDVKESCVLPTRWMISCNQMPVLHDTSGALEARMLVLRFNRTFAGQEDPRLLDKLLTELSGIAVWAIQGLRRLRESGWTAPASSVEEKKAFRRDSSIPLAFLQDCCQVSSSWLNALTPDVQGIAEECFVTREDMSSAFWLWSVEQGDEDSRGFKWFCRDVRSLIPQFGQVEAKKNVAGKWVRVYEGVRLKQEWVQQVVKNQRKA
jgi:P4 family phage/plasmid primase-like protien